MTSSVKTPWSACTGWTARARCFGDCATCTGAGPTRSLYGKCHAASGRPGEECPMAVESAAVYGAPATGKVENKGLKTNAIGYVSNIVIGVASTAPAYSLAATLGFIVADKGVGIHAPARAAGVVRADAADLARLPLPEQGGPRLGHHVRVDDARLRADVRVAQRLGDLPRRHARDGLARLHRGDLHLPAVRMALRRNPRLGGARRLRPVDLADDVDLPPRHRVVGTHPAGAARLRVRDAR